MLKILDIIELPNHNRTLYNNIYKPIDNNDSFIYNSYNFSIDVSNVRKLLVIFLFEIKEKRILIEAFCIKISDNKIIPFFLKYRDLSTNIINDLTILENISNLNECGYVNYKNNDSFNNFCSNSTVNPFYNRILPVEFKSDAILRDYQNDDLYKGYCKLNIHNIYSITNSLLSTVFRKNIKRNNDLIKTFEYILFNMDYTWEEALIRKFKYMFIDTEFINRLLRISKRTPMLTNIPRSLKGINTIFVNNSDFELYHRLLLNPISDFHIKFKNILNYINASSSLDNYIIKYAYSSLAINMNNINYDEIFNLIGLLKEIVYSSNFHKSKVPIDVDIIKNLYGELYVSIDVLNEEPPYVFFMDLFMLPFVSDGLETSFY